MQVEVKLNLPQEVHADLVRRAHREGRTLEELLTDRAVAPDTTLGGEETPTSALRGGVNTDASSSDKPSTTSVDDLGTRRAAYERLLATIEELPPLQTLKTDKELIYEYVDEKYGKGVADLP